MPRDSSGNYALPAGNPVVSNQVIASTWANTTMSDLAAELTNSLDRQGRGGMLAPFKFVDGTVSAPGITFTGEPTTGFYRAGANDMRWSLNNSDVARAVAAGFQFFRAAAWRTPLDAAADAAITGTWTYAGVSLRNADLINAGTFGVDRIPTLTAAKIPTLDASKIGTGTFDAARIPTLDAAKIGTGVLGTARLGTGTANSSVFLRGDGTWAAPPTTSVSWGDIGGTLASQTDLNSALAGKQATITGAATTVVSANLTASRALVSDGSGKIAVSPSITSTELGYLDGVTSGIQAQLNGKEATLNADQKRKITISDSGPSGGSDGDIWLEY